jgi:hypothetical protein
LQEFKGYAFKIMGGCDKHGFPVKQGVLTPRRVHLLPKCKTFCIFTKRLKSVHCLVPLGVFAFCSTGIRLSIFPRNV